VLSSPQEEVMYNLLRSIQLDKAAWMDWLIDPSRPKPPELTGDWKIYESTAVMSEATLRLARVARDKSEVFTEISYSPEHLWFMVEASDFMDSVSPLMNQQDGSHTQQQTPQNEGVYSSTHFLTCKTRLSQINSKFAHGWVVSKMWV